MPQTLQFTSDYVGRDTKFQIRSALWFTMTDNTPIWPVFFTTCVHVMSKSSYCNEVLTIHPWLCIRCASFWQVWEMDSSSLFHIYCPKNGVYRRYSSDEAYSCVPISTSKFSLITVSHTIHSRPNASVDPKCSICYAPVGEGLVHVKSGYLLQPTTDSSFQQAFTIETPVIFYCQLIAHIHCLLLKASTQPISFLHRRTQTYMLPGVIYNNTAGVEDTGKEECNSGSENAPRL